VAVRRALAALRRRELVVKLGTMRQRRACRWHLDLKAY
jgi:hypothetical protein